MSTSLEVNSKDLVMIPQISDDYTYNPKTKQIYSQKLHKYWAKISLGVNGYYGFSQKYGNKQKTIYLTPETIEDLFANPKIFAKDLRTRKDVKTSFNQFNFKKAGKPHIRVDENGNKVKGYTASQIAKGAKNKENSSAKIIENIVTHEPNQTASKFQYPTLDEKSDTKSNNPITPTQKALSQTPTVNDIIKTLTEKLNNFEQQFKQFSLQVTSYNTYKAHELDDNIQEWLNNNLAKSKKNNTLSDLYNFYKQLVNTNINTLDQLVTTLPISIHDLYQEFTLIDHINLKLINYLANENETSTSLLNDYLKLMRNFNYTNTTLPNETIRKMYTLLDQMISLKKVIDSNKTKQLLEYQMANRKLMSAIFETNNQTIENHFKDITDKTNGKMDQLLQRFSDFETKLDSLKEEKDQKSLFSKLFKS